MTSWLFTSFGTAAIETCRVGTCYRPKKPLSSSQTLFFRRKKNSPYPKRPPKNKPNYSDLILQLSMLSLLSAILQWFLLFAKTTQLKCPQNSQWNGTQCVCRNGFYGKITTDGTDGFRGACFQNRRDSKVKLQSLFERSSQTNFQLASMAVSTCNLPHCLSYDPQCSCTNCSTGFFLNSTPGQNTSCSACHTCPAWQYAANCTTNSTGGTCTTVPCPNQSTWNGSWCLCNSGFRGNLRSIPQAPYIIGSCTDINE